MSGRVQAGEARAGSLRGSAAIGVALLLGAAVGGCGSAAQPSASSEVTLRLGYFPNVTHATAVVGVADGIYADSLGDDVTLDVRTFNAGPDVIEAMFSGALDASFIGPNPAINGFTRSGGQAIRIIAGATSGGAFFVVRDGIASAADLIGTKIATPQLGNTQDVALRAWLHDQGLTADEQGGGDVAVVPQGNAQTLETFRAGQIDGAWVPEPWASRLIEEGGGHVLVDERDLWPAGQYVTTHLIVRTEFLAQQPDIVRRLLDGHLRATDYVNTSPAEAQASAIEAIRQITGSALSPTIMASAWTNLTFTVDPITASLQESADDAQALGFLPSAELDGIYDLALLNEVLRVAGRPEIAQP